MWHFLFEAANWLAMICWILLILAPRKNLILSAILYIGVALLCLTYTLTMGLVMGEVVDPIGPADAAVDFTRIEGVQAIFATLGGTLIGWTHYLAFDLFVGLWIAKDADAKHVARWVQAPILLLTYMVGPVGLLVWLILRESRARKAAKDRAAQEKAAQKKEVPVRAA